MCAGDGLFNSSFVQRGTGIHRTLSGVPDPFNQQCQRHLPDNTRVGTLIVATIYLQLIQNRHMFRSFTVLQCTSSHQHCVQPVASDVEVVGYL